MLVKGNKRGQIGQRGRLALLAAPVAVLLFITTLTIGAPLASAQGSVCTTDVYDDAQTAKSRFATDCGQPFTNTSAYRCDWVPGGWVCSGPGQAGNTSAASPRDQPAAAKPLTPNITEAKHNGSFVGVKWASNAGYAKVEIYRDTRDGRGLQYLTTVTSGNVLNDWNGQPDDIYQVLAHDRAGSLSDRSNFLVATGKNTYDTSSLLRNGNRRRNPFTFGPSLDELSSKSPAKEQNQQLLQRYKEALQQQQDDWQYIMDLRAAEEIDRQIAEARAQAEADAARDAAAREEADRNADAARREREAQRDRDSDRDQAERNNAGHANPGSDAGTDELSGYAG